MAFFRSIDVSRLPDVGEKPNQPQGFSFPKRTYGHKKVTNSRNGSSDGGGFTMIMSETRSFVFCV